MCLSLHICCLIFLYFYRSGWYFLQLIVSGFFSFFFLRKAITGSIEKVFYKVLFVFKMGQWFWIICFILGGVQLHVIVSGNTWAFCLAFGVRNSFLPKSLIFLIDFNWRWTITSFCKLLLQYFTIALEIHCLLNRFIYHAVFDRMEYFFWVMLRGQILDEDKNVSLLSS